MNQSQSGKRCWNQVCLRGCKCSVRLANMAEPVKLICRLRGSTCRSSRGRASLHSPKLGRSWLRRCWHQLWQIVRNVGIFTCTCPCWLASVENDNRNALFAVNECCWSDGVALCEKCRAQPEVWKNAMENDKAAFDSRHGTVLLRMLYCARLLQKKFWSGISSMLRRGCKIWRSCTKPACTEENWHRKGRHTIPSAFTDIHLKGCIGYMRIFCWWRRPRLCLREVRKRRTRSQLSFKKFCERLVGRKCWDSELIEFHYCLRDDCYAKCVEQDDGVGCIIS